MKTRKSKFDSKHLLIFFEESDEKYKDFEKIFQKHGLAFKHGNNIFFDMPQLRKEKKHTNEYIVFIEAHEIAHSILGHTKSSSYVEAEADYLAIILCEEKKFMKSRKIGISNFESRNKISYDKFKKKYEKSILKKIKI